MQKLKVNEIFYSIQGEGHNTGMPAIFIRLSGCNMTCNWCDTKYHVKGVKRSISEICDIVRDLKCRSVVITGGEPLMQDILGLVRTLKNRNYYVCLETNGTIKMSHELWSLIDWITVSPKYHKLEQNFGEELKLVWEGQRLGQYEDLMFEYFYLQPKSGKNIKAVVDVVKSKKKWRLSLQCHKIINIR